jgi:uncharacterized protein YbcC (UPF0753/DUF2309 family)
MQANLRTIAPAWPLQNTVAVNPFWNQINRPFNEVMNKMSALVHHPLYMPNSYYLEKYRDGEITEQDLEIAIKYGVSKENHVQVDVAQFIYASAQAEAEGPECQSFTDFLDRRDGSTWNSFVIYEIAKYASAFFDEGQALAKFPWRDLSFYQAWFAAQEFDRSFQKKGATNFHDLIAEFREIDAQAAITKIISRWGFINETEMALYIGRLSVLNLGWASQFSYHEWRGQLGYSVSSKVRSIDLLAIQMIVDWAIAKFTEKSHPGIIEEWVQSFQADAASLISGPDHFAINRIWQEALEWNRQRQVASKIKPCEAKSTVPRVQVAMCIDVRSETYRRAIESASSEIETIGFAGFFGLPFDYKKIDEDSYTERAPVLLKTGFVVHEEMAGKAAKRRMVGALARSYFRNLRKAPMSSFLFVELLILVACRKIVSSFFGSLQSSVQSQLPLRFADKVSGPSQKSVSSDENKVFQTKEKVELAAKVLAHMGIKNRFARLVVLAGHGSHNTNNAFRSASDCGACGGHAGDVNARFLADLLNDADIRRELNARMIEIPVSTRFVAAVHETVTDNLYLLDRELVSDSHKYDLDFISAAIETAGPLARAERQFARSSCLDPSPSRRAKNWSEVRPEWALTGNSCFIVAPRRFTKDANFDGRCFLHDYDWRDDFEFETLELILTAPMLVTNWINFQYYASTVAPKVYGSGNKVLHNLVNENGVAEGNGGDLRIGLPWQSINDGNKFVHEPVRLAVYIAAPVAEIEKVIAKHQAVRDLVVNQWLFVFHVDDKSGKSCRRTIDGKYLPSNIG